MNSKKNIIILFAALLFVILATQLPYESELSRGLGLFVFIAILWLTEAVPISVTALLVPLLAVVTGIFEVSEALANFAHPIIFLFLGGFSLAAALKKQELDRALAYRVVVMARGRLLYAALMLFALTAALSMWVSNTATTALMLPLVLGIMSQLNKVDNSLAVFLLLGIAYSATSGGIATLVGSPPNAIVAAEMGLGFYDWLSIGLPAFLVIFPLILFSLWLMIRPNLEMRFEFQSEEFTLDRSRLLTIAIFVLTASLWIFSKPIAEYFGGVKSFDSLVALFAIGLIGITRVATWKDIDSQVDWGVLILFGGGLTLSAVLKVTGVSDFVAHGLSSWMVGMSTLLIIGAVAAFVVFLTELSSNSASAAILVPIFIPVADSLGVPPLAMAATIGIAASCAFMLPVATPPNAIVFGSGHIKLDQMIKYGSVLNVICIVVLMLISSTW